MGRPATRVAEPSSGGPSHPRLDSMEAKVGQMRTGAGSPCRIRRLVAGGVSERRCGNPLGGTETSWSSAGAGCLAGLPHCAAGLGRGLVNGFAQVSGLGQSPQRLFDQLHTSHLQPADLGCECIATAGWRFQDVDRSGGHQVPGLPGNEGMERGITQVHAATVIGATQAPSGRSILRSSRVSSSQDSGKVPGSLR